MVGYVARTGQISGVSASLARRLDRKSSLGRWEHIKVDLEVIAWECVDVIRWA